MQNSNLYLLYGSLAIFKPWLHRYVLMSLRFHSGITLIDQLESHTWLVLPLARFLAQLKSKSDNKREEDKLISVIIVACSCTLYKLYAVMKGGTQ